MGLGQLWNDKGKKYVNNICTGRGRTSAHTHTHTHTHTNRSCLRPKQFLIILIILSLCIT